MENKTERLEIRLTPKQQTEIRLKAKQAGLTVTEYVRRKILHGEVGVMDSLTFLKEFHQYNHEISKIGNNINQLAHYANILNKEDTYSKDVIEEMTIQLRQLTETEMEIKSLASKILKV